MAPKYQTVQQPLLAQRDDVPHYKTVSGWSTYLLLMVILIGFIVLISWFMTQPDNTTGILIFLLVICAIFFVAINSTFFGVYDFSKY